ncbi:hypothetical protein HNR46_002817 [Haloferula luteola]|uniref:Uncharacterized protein n=1 Tax=Haloferula luteola TaxID=595692 RepID=A0A840VIN9_9BACT|nr:hypothetical protein [Haloferula luteola]MBB5352571.1 hypothetical protein [Haloferula luteola]
MLGSWFPSSRDRFTEADFEFLAGLLAPGDGRRFLWTLWEDREALREMLDLKEVLRGLLEGPSAVQVSPYFYFYVLVRHAFLEAGIEDVGVADYVAGVLSERVGADPDDVLRGIPTGLVHAADFVTIMENAHGRLRFHLQLAAGNQFLVLTGLFPAFLRRRSERCGAPGVGFYESFARRVFHDVAENPSAPRELPRRMLNQLSECLPQARRSLNKMAEDYVFLGD